MSTMSHISAFVGVESLTLPTAMIDIETVAAL